MSRSRMTQVLAVVLAITFSTSALFADSAAGMLYARGSVMLNGNKVDTSSAVFFGDKVQTGEDSAVAFTSAGATVLVPANSSVVLEKNNVELVCGTALVATSSALGAKVGNLTIAPAAKEAKFELTQTTAELRVTAREGDLKISDSRTEMTLAAGQSMTAAGGCSTGIVYNAAASTRSAAPPASASYAVGALAWVVIAASVGTAVGLGIYYAVRDTSPDTP